MGKDLSTIVRDLPITIDLEAARLGDYDRDTVVRLFREYEFRTLIERLPPMAGESAEQRIESLRSVAESGYVPGGARRRPARGLGPAPLRRAARERRAAAPARLRRRRRPARRPVGPERRPAATAPTDRHARPAEDLPSALAAAIVDPGRIEVRGADDIADLEPWLAAQPAVGVALLRGRSAAASRLAAGPRGRRRRWTRRRGRWPGGRGRAPAPARAARHPARRPRGQAGPRRPLRRRPRGAAAARRLRHADRGLRPERRAPEPDDRRRRRREPRPDPAAGDGAAGDGPGRASRPCRRSPSASRSSDASPTSSSTGCSARSSCRSSRSSPGWRPSASPSTSRRSAVLDREFAAEIARLEAEIYVDVGHEFNLGSPKQLEQILFFELNLPKGKRTKTGYSTDASVLEELRPAHPMIDKLLEWRVYTKLRSTYVEALPNLMAADGRLHTTFHQAVASTGRLSSSDPNLQNIPIRTPLGRRIRRAFVAGAPDLTLLAADYSQIELRILAHVSGDEHLKDAFARQADIHRETAARVLHKAPEDITHGERSMAKMVNFGLAYGMSDFGLASRANIPRKEAQEFINSYFAAYSGISYYMMAIKEQAKAQGFVETLLGRKRQIPELRASNPALRGAGERMAINMPIQGTAADIQKIAMIRVAERLAAAGSRARLLLSVHDELLFEVPRDEVERPGRARPRDDGGRAAAVGAAHRRHQGRRRLGVDDAADPGRRDRRRGRRAAARGADRPARRVGRRQCRSFPRSRPSPATCAR